MAPIQNVAASPDIDKAKETAKEREAMLSDALGKLFTVATTGKLLSDDIVMPDIKKEDRSAIAAQTIEEKEVEITRLKSENERLVAESEKYRRKLSQAELALVKQEQQSELNFSQQSESASSSVPSQPLSAGSPSLSTGKMDSANDTATLANLRMEIDQLKQDFELSEMKRKDSFKVVELKEKELETKKEEMQKMSKEMAQLQGEIISKNIEAQEQADRLWDYERRFQELQMENKLRADELERVKIDLSAERSQVELCKSTIEKMDHAPIIEGYKKEIELAKRRAKVAEESAKKEKQNADEQKRKREAREKEIMSDREILKRKREEIEKVFFSKRETQNKLCDLLPQLIQTQSGEAKELLITLQNQITSLEKQFRSLPGDREHASAQRTSVTSSSSSGVSSSERSWKNTSTGVPKPLGLTSSSPNLATNSPTLGASSSGGLQRPSLGKRPISRRSESSSAAEYERSELHRQLDAERAKNTALSLGMGELEAVINEHIEENTKLLEQMKESDVTITSHSVQLYQLRSELAAARSVAESADAKQKLALQTVEMYKEALGRKQVELSDAIGQRDALKEKAGECEQELVKARHENAVVQDELRSTVSRAKLLEEEKTTLQQEKAKLIVFKEKLEHIQNSGSGASREEVERLKREIEGYQRKLRCQCCNDREKNTVISRCWHVFCKECVENNMKYRSRKCPACMQPFGYNDVHELYM